MKRDAIRPELENKDAIRLTQGRALVSLWTDLLRALRIVDLRSEQVQSWGERIRALLSEACDDSEGASLAVRADAIFFNGVRLPELGDRATAYRSFARLLRIARVRSFHCQAEVELAELLRFADRLLAAAEGRAAPEEIVAALKPSGESGIEVVVGNTEDESAIQIPGRELQRRVHLGAVGSMKSVYHELRSANRISARRVKRAVQDLIGSLAHDPSYALRLTSIKNYDEYTFNHSVNVAVLSMALGQRIGLSRRRLYTLGIAAMLHDLGKLAVPPHVLNKLGALTPEERKLFHDHPGEGLFFIAGQLGVTSDTIPVALCAYEHHLNVDGTGYPAQATSRAPGLLSRIVAITDRYDAMTSPRIYRLEPISPPRVLAIMYHTQRNQIDRALLRYFMNMLGRYPMGSAVRLSDGSVALVVAAAADEAKSELPSVRVIASPTGERVEGDVLDLAAGTEGSSPLRVVETLDTLGFELDPARYLL